jgi:3-oxosteroid 1-dehydrogenase
MEMDEKLIRSRRSFLATASAGVSGLLVGASAAAATAPTAIVAPSVVRRAEVTHWDDTADVIVCGSGAAGLTASAIATSMKARVILVEKADTIGGTTVKAGGGLWVPNNSLMRARGYVDRKPDALAYMARCSAPQLFDPALPRYGLAQNDFDLLEAYYDNAAAALDELGRIGALRSTFFGYAEYLIQDYHPDLPENKAPIGRCLGPAAPDGSLIASGAEIVEQMSAAVSRLGVHVLLKHRLVRLVTDESRRIVGVQVDSGGKTLSLAANKAVVLATGGFTHNSALVEHHLRGPIFGGCAVPTNTGDIIPLATDAGAALGNMTQAWWAEVVVDEALVSSSVSVSIFFLRGDSMLVVNRFGKRMYNEKTLYNERSQAHFTWDPANLEYPNLLGFMIYDERVATRNEYAYPIPFPTKGARAPYVISAPDIPALAAAIQKHLQSLANKAGVSARIASNFKLAPDFIKALMDTVERFNGFAESGKDLDFARGGRETEIALPPNPPNGKPNPTMYPLAATGPYHCIILGAGTLDTRGGPVINARSQIVDSAGAPIAGLYGAGNCIAAPTKQGYWGSGCTLGSAVTFGYLAARNALVEPVQQHNERVSGAQ